MAGIESLGTCSIHLEALGRLQLEIAARQSPYGAPHGLVRFMYKRRTGENARDGIYIDVDPEHCLLRAPPIPSDPRAGIRDCTSDYTF